MTFLRAFAADERGATAIEYGLIAALIAVVVIAGLTIVGSKLKLMLSATGNKMVAPT